MNAQLEYAPKPRLGFLGTGWIGLARLRALADSGAGDVVAIADTSPEALRAAAEAAPWARAEDSLRSLLDHDLDGVVIATPNDEHAAQAIAALEHGVAVFCQKPLGRTAAETHEIVAAARRQGRPLGVDFSYRGIAGIADLKNLVQSGALGTVYSAELTFHNAYGPGKAWFHDARRSGGGCVIDLGVHLIDLAQWITGETSIRSLDAKLYARGDRLRSVASEVEDYAAVQWCTDGGICVRMSCSWRLHAGCSAEIRAAFFGTRGGAALRNIGGSFNDFVVERYEETHTRCLHRPSDSWAGGALIRWAKAVADGKGFDPECERLVDVAAAVDEIYGR